MSTGRPRTRLTVWDNARLAAAVDAVVKRQFAGNLVRAAKGIGIERSLLARLRSGVPRSLSIRDLIRLRKSLSREEFEEIERALVSPRAAEALAAFDAWVRGERDRLLYRDTAAETEVGRAVASVAGWEMQRELEYRHLLGIVRMQFSALIAGFDRWLQRRQHSRSRGELAYTRILAPLLDFRESGCIERRWEEMSERELLRFIEAGIEREKILMDRPSEVQQAQNNDGRDPIEFIGLYGQLWDPRAFTGRNTDGLIKRWVAQRRTVRQPQRLR